MASCFRQTQSMRCQGGVASNQVQHKAAVSRLRCVQARAASSTTEAAIPVDLSTVKRMRLRALSDCQLGVSVYPIFAYNALGGGGWADVQHEGNGILRVRFEPEGMIIPALNWRTASIFGVPIPPPLNIAVTTQRLEGTVNTVTGEVLLDFDAVFVFTAADLYKAPPLQINTVLTTGYTKGRFREGTGKPFKGLKGTLAGTSNVPKTSDGFMDTFLMLPTDALAVMSAELEFE